MEPLRLEQCFEASCFQTDLDEFVRLVLKEPTAKYTIYNGHGEYRVDSELVNIKKSSLIKALDAGFSPNKLLISIIQNYEKDEALKELISLAFVKGAHLEYISFSDLKFDRLSLPVFEVLLEYGLDQNALVLKCNPRHEFTLNIEVMKLMQSRNVKPTWWTILQLLLNRDTKQEQALIDFLINNTEIAVNKAIYLDEVLNELIMLGPKFQEYLNDEDQVYEMQDIMMLFEGQSTYGGSLLHMAARFNKLGLISALLNRADINVNSLNDKGQTPLFFARTVEVITMLMENNADLNIRDINGDLWINNPSLDVIKYLAANNRVPEAYKETILYNHFYKGNFEHARRIYNMGGVKLEVPLILGFVKALEIAIANSIENNKYHALLNLMAKTDIDIPYQLHHLLYSIEDHNVREQDIIVIHNLLPQLARSYLDISKKQLQKNVMQDCPQITKILDAINLAFEAENGFAYFAQSKLLCPQNKALDTIDDNFDALYQTLGKALIELDNDFALQVLTINGMLPAPLKEDTVVFRGLMANLDIHDINAWFKYGHRAFSNGENQKFLGYYVNEDWNRVASRWQLGGTYVSLDTSKAAYFSLGVSSDVNAESIVMEIKLSKGSPCVCGSSKNLAELVVSTIDGPEVLGLYKIDSNYRVLEVFLNPYFSDDLKLRYNVGEIFGSYTEYDELQGMIWDSLSCNDQVYKNYDDFLARYSAEDHGRDQYQFDQWYGVA